MPSCSVSITPKGYFILTVHKTPAGFGVMVPPFFKHSLEMPQSAIGASIIESLSSAQKDFDHSGQEPNAILKFAGYRSWRAFERDSIALIVRLNEAGGVTVTPSDPAPRGGYLHRPDEARSCPLDAGEIGVLLIAMAGTKSAR